MRPRSLALVAFMLLLMAGVAGAAAQGDDGTGLLVPATPTAKLRVYTKPIEPFSFQKEGRLPESSPLRKRINTILLELSEAGVIDDLRTKSFGDQ